RGLRGRFQGRLCRGRGRQQGSRQPAQSVDHYGGHPSGCQEGRGQGRLRRGDRIGEGSRSPGQSVDLSGDERKKRLEGARNPLIYIFVIARSEATKQSMAAISRLWIASLRSQ